MAITLGELRRTTQRIADVANLGPTREPQRNYMFEASIYGGSNNVRDLQFYVKTLTLPARGSELIVEEYLDQQLVFAGKKASNHTIQMTLWDDQSGTVQQFLHGWSDLIHYSPKSEKDNDPSFGGGVSKEFHKKELAVELKDTTDIFKTVKYVFTGAVISEIGEINLSYDSSDMIEIPVTIAFDKMKVKVGADVATDLETLKGIIGF